jgi:heme-degrading monooxygenase HmoA
VVRGFVVEEGRERDFEEVFSRGGIWQELLGRSPGYLKSSVRLELFGGQRRYKVFDYWRSHQDFEQCRSEQQEEIERLSLLLVSEGTVRRATVLGSFYEEGPDESGLVLR